MCLSNDIFLFLFCLFICLFICCLHDCDFIFKLTIFKVSIFCFVFLFSCFFLHFTDDFYSSFVIFIDLLFIHDFCMFVVIIFRLPNKKREREIIVAQSPIFIERIKNKTRKQT